ncbi:MAG: fructose-6-phosphate aldolase [Bacteroidia bacterium]|nr:fructose-6-phosphate aldolase [Bacteroidia bacterium]MCX7652547.1 fructose-6-phosphate aldolase [Bacteroidia bacterium]MDW8417530.1 fructose-6-phosphate aldolase [Bacteroidia bacterium]
MKKRYYILKVKGVAKIPDYIQIRDERFSLVCYVRPDRVDKRTALPEGFLEKVSLIFPQLAYGEVRPVEWNPETREICLT